MSVVLAQLLAIIHHRSVVTGCLALIVLVGAANYPLWQHRLAVAQQHETVRRNGEIMLRALANRAQIEADLAALRPALAQIEQELVDERSMEINLGYFYKLERMTRVRLLRLNQLVSSPPRSGSPFKAVPFAMQVSGSYRNGMSFLRALETGPRILRVRSCSFDRSGADRSELVLDLTVDLLAKS